MVRRSKRIGKPLPVVDCDKYKLDTKIFNFSDPQKICCTCKFCAIIHSPKGDEEDGYCRLDKKEFKY